MKSGINSSMYNFECRDNEEFCDNEKILKKQFIINLLVAWCVHKQTATNLIEPKMWPLLWMEWQEILHEVGHPHLVQTIRGWHGSASGTERSHAIHGSTDGTPWPCQTRTPCHPCLAPNTGHPRTLGRIRYSSRVWRAPGRLGASPPTGQNPPDAPQPPKSRAGGREENKWVIKDLCSR